MTQGSIVVLSGGVGGAKLCLGLQRVLPPGALSVVVNTGDDFDHLGLRICPDVDTTLYTLGGLANTELGWGRRDETWTFMRTLESIGGETWFRLGDADLALHVERTRRLAAGDTLGGIIADIAQRFGIVAQILPMSEQAVPTMVATPDGELGFQDYFVRRQCRPPVSGIRFDGAERADIAPGVRLALASPRLEAIVIAPSNPYLSIDPILSLPGMRTALRAAGVPIIAVTPIIGDSAVKGPTAKIMRELGLVPSPLSIAAHYRDLIDGFVLDSRDAELAAQFDLPLHACDTLMQTLEDRERVALAVLGFSAQLRGQRHA